MPSSHRRWYSFTLWKLLVLVTGACIALVPINAISIRLRTARRLQERAISVLWEDGDCVGAWDVKRCMIGLSMHVDTEDDDIPLDLIARLRPVSSAHFCGLECPLNDRDLALLGEFRELRELTIDSSQFTTDGVRSISQLPDLEVLQLRGNARMSGAGPAISRMKSLRLLVINSSYFTDSDLHYVTAITRLEVLDVSGTSITDAGIAHVAAIETLRELYCDLTDITDECIPAIATLKNLRELHIDLTNISPEGRQRLRGLLSHPLRITPPAKETTGKKSEKGDGPEKGTMRPRK